MLNSLSYPLQECECGLTITFPNPSANLPRQDEYLIYFNLESSLPRGLPATVTISPKSYALSGSNSFDPKTVVSVKSVHRGETQSLLRLVITDKFNKILHTDYLRLVCFPKALVGFKASFKAPPDNTGPNGGAIIVVDTAAELDIGMQVTGGGITATDNVYIINIINDNEVEVTEGFNYTGGYTLKDFVFTRVTNCTDPETLRNRESESLVTILDKTNNWTYEANGKIMIQFIREDLTDQEIAVIVPAKNKAILPSEFDSMNIPGFSILYTVGRVNNDQFCIT